MDVQNQAEKKLLEQELKPVDTAKFKACTSTKTQAITEIPNHLHLSKGPKALD
jgi:hypothetical protein